MDYASQLKSKQQKLLQSLAFAGDFSVLPPVSSPQQGFRNRAKMVVTGTVEAPRVGLTGESSLDEGRELLDCPIHHPRLNQLIAALPEWIRNYKLTPYQIAARTGELKGLILYFDEGSDEMYLRFVLRSKECVSRIQKLVPSLQNRFPGLKCVSANIQPVPHAILEGPEEIFISSEKYIRHTLGDLTLKLSPRAFVQTNAKVAVQLYQTASRWMQEFRPKRMLELYSGQGAFSFVAASALSDSFEEILGVEINPDAVVTANETVREFRENGQVKMAPLKFQCADATQVGAIGQDFRPDLILVNPPRRGLGEGVKLIEQILPKHLIYSSCAVDTLEKDLRYLSRKYQITKAQLFDMFPHTEHFEVLTCLTRLE
jgi:23S rRNA (uracil747-C5)-methyltransferase